MHVNSVLRTALYWAIEQRVVVTRLRHVTRMDNKRMPKIKLNCTPNGRRRIGRLLMRQLYKAETGKSRPN
jgi:hypothetical protein